MLLRRKRLEREAKEQHDPSIEELKLMLDKKGIKYDAKAKKQDLIKLLKGAE